MIEPQLYINFSGKEPSPENFKAPYNDLYTTLRNKPRGGLWTSTYNETEGSDWIRWCHRHNFHTAAGWHAWLLYPSPDARIYEIDNPVDLRKIIDKYPFESPDFQKFYRKLTIDFEKAAEVYDAIHLSARGEASTKFDFNAYTENGVGVERSLYGWDCESTLWLHWKFSKVEYLGVERWDSL